MTRSFKSSLQGQAFGAVMVTLIWVALFRLNDWIFGFSKVSDHVSWIFLPAALRMLAVMCLGWGGVLGLFVGAILTSHPDASNSHVLITACLSSVPALLAARLVSRVLGLPPDLSGLHAPQLFWFGLTGALFNVIGHSLYFHLTDSGSDALAGFMPMLAGDLVGTLVLLYFASLAMRLLSRA